MNRAVTASAVVVATASNFAYAARPASLRGPFTTDPVQAIAARGGAVAALVSGRTGPEVLLLTRARPGAPMLVTRRWPAPSTDADDGRSANRPSHDDELDDLLWHHALPDGDRDAWVVDDLREAQGLDEAPRRRQRTPKDTRPIPRALAADATDLWMATSAGIWRLDGAGSTARWRPSGLSAHDLNAITVSSPRAGLFVVTARSTSSTWRSIDRGQTWEHTPDAPGQYPDATDDRDDDLPFPVTAMARADGELWIGTRQGLYAADSEGEPARVDSDALRVALRSVSALESPIPPCTPRPRWLDYLPRLSIELGAGGGAERHEVRALMRLTVPLAAPLARSARAQCPGTGRHPPDLTPVPDRHASTPTRQADP